MNLVTQIDALQTSLLDLGHEVVNLYVIKQRTTKTLLALLSINLYHKENNKQIYNILKLTNIVIGIRWHYQKIPRCTRTTRDNKMK